MSRIYDLEPAMPKITVTILTGVSHYDAARKSFRWGDNDAPELASDYKMGRYFCWRVETLTPGSELFSLQEIINRYADQPRSFRIAGSPAGFLTERHRDEVVHRTGEFFEDPPQGTHIILLDIDGWKTSIPWWLGTDKLELAIHSLLNERRLEYLSTKDCLCVLSQSAWPHHPLKAHLYFYSSTPTTLADLRLWARSVNARLGTKDIDASVFRGVQPDYIARRECIGFKDPFKRHTFIIPGDEYVLCDESIFDGMRREYADVTARIERGEIARPLDEVGSVSGDGWDLVSHAGEGGQINEWGYRAAARIVRDEGKQRVTERLEAYAQRMHDIAWNGKDGLGGIMVNSEGTRGDASDMATYNVDRFRQYLFSACQTTIGDEVERHVDVLQKAIEGGAVSAFTKEAIDAAARLQLNWPGHFSELRALVARERSIQSKLWDKAVTDQVKALERSRRISSDEARSALTSGVSVAEGGKLDELAFFNMVAATYDWVCDGQQTVLLDRQNEQYRDSGGYLPLPLGSFKSHLTRRVREVMHSIDPSMRVPLGSETIITDLIMSDVADKQQIYNGECPSKQWGRRSLVRRAERTADGVVWLNLGYEGGSFNCLRCTTDGVERMTWHDSLKRFPDAPIWIGHNHGLGMGHNDPMGLAELDHQQIITTGLRDSPEGEWHKLLFELIKLHGPDDEIIIIAWLLSVILDWDTRFILQLNGVQGAGKSVAGDILCALVDPPSEERVLKTQSSLRLGSSSLEPRALSLSLRNRSTAMFDNLLRLTASQQERLCTLATGLSFSESVKYLNAIDHIQLKTSIIMTGISGAVTQPDLQERVLNVEIEPRERYPLNPEMQFQAYRGIILDGLVRMGMMVLREMQRGGDEYGTRSGLIAAAARVYYGKRGAEVLLEKTISDSAELIKNDRFAGCLVAWFRHDLESWGEEGKLEGKEASASDLYEAYKSWFRGAAHGRIFTIYGAHLMDSFQVKISQRYGDKKLVIPANVVHFARQLRKWCAVTAKFTAQVTAQRGSVTAQTEKGSRHHAPVSFEYKRVNNRSIWVIKTVDESAQ